MEHGFEQLILVHNERNNMERSEEDMERVVGDGDQEESGVEETVVVEEETDDEDETEDTE
jgi:hypothetical protein